MKSVFAFLALLIVAASADASGCVGQFALVPQQAFVPDQSFVPVQNFVPVRQAVVFNQFVPIQRNVQFGLINVNRGVGFVPSRQAIVVPRRGVVNRQFGLINVNRR